MSTSVRQMHLGLMFWAGGTHPAGWRLPGSHAAAAFDIEFLQHVTQEAERAKFDFLFLGDRLASDPALQKTNPAQMTRLEPFVSGASLAAATSRIGIVVTANPTYYDPYTVARLLASLDHLSQGRASWNLVTGADAIAAGNFSRDAHWDTETRYDRADEFVTAVRSLWDGAERPARVHNHRGDIFDIAGPLGIARPPQGYPVILHAGTSDRSRQLGARDADVIFAGQGTIEAAKGYYADIKLRAAKYGRDPESIKILPGMTPIVAETTEEAVAIYDRLNALIPLDPEAEPGTEARFGALGRGRLRNLGTLGGLIGVNLAGRDPDDAVSADVFEQSNEEGRRLFAEAQRLTRRSVGGARAVTYRDLIQSYSNLGAFVVGNAGEVADHLQLWFEERAADGFNIFPTHVPDAVTDFTRLVVPLLQERGLFRREYTGPTFRDHLGLPIPEIGRNEEIRIPEDIDAARLRASVLVEAGELKATIDARRKIVVLDVGGVRPGRQTGRTEGVPGAQPVDLASELAEIGGGELGARPLPDIETLQRNARRWGIDADTEVVLYDDRGNLQAARGWWVLRWAGLRNVRLLDGGLRAWTDAGFPLEQLSEPAVEGTVELSAGHLPTIDTEEAGALAAEGRLFDARDTEVYLGPDGHIPGSLSLPARGNLQANARFAASEDLRERFRRFGVFDGRVGLSCGSGVSAAHNVAALATLGISAELYVGSWSAWSADPLRPREVGAPAQ